MVSWGTAVTGVAVLALVKVGGNQGKDETKDAGKEAIGKKRRLLQSNNSAAYISNDQLVPAQASGSVER